MSNILTVQELRDRCDQLVKNNMGDTHIYAYCGSDGIKVQAEWPQGFTLLLTSPLAIPQSGGAAV